MIRMNNDIDNLLNLTKLLLIPCLKDVKLNLG